MKTIKNNPIVGVENVGVSTSNDFDQLTSSVNNPLVDLGNNKDQNSDIDTQNNDLMKSNVTNKVDTFEELGLKKDLLRGIYGYGFEYPSPIQQKAILPMIQKNDVIAQAQSGSGKTATFTIGALELINPQLDEVQSLILCHTKELARQTEKVVRNFGQDYLKTKSHVFTGGTNLKDDINALKVGIHIGVGTPGRVLSMIDKKELKLTNLKILILDEADEMLSRGFIEDMKKIVSYIPPEANIWLVSATMPKEIVELSSKFMNNPKKILVRNEDLPLSGIKQYYVMLQKNWKIDALISIYMGLDITQAMIFCNAKNTVDFVSEELRKRGHMVSTMHSNLEHLERKKVMEEFIAGASRVLVSSDVLAKGIDVYQVSLVINYDLPKNKETYLHRIGRAGRYGRKGNAINFVTPDEKEDLEQIQKHYGFTIEKLPTDLGDL